MGHSANHLAPDQLADAVTTLIDTAEQYPHYSLDDRNITRSQWVALLEPAIGRLQAQGIEPRVSRSLEAERQGPDLGLGL